MQKSFDDEVAAERRLAWPYPYGLIEARLSRDELENKRVRFDKLRAIMPSGLEVNYPAGAELPSLDIAQAFARGDGSFTVSLGVPLWQGSRANTVPVAQDSDARAKLLYRVSETECYDENTGENPKPVQVRKINSRLVFEHEDVADMEVLPLMRIVRATGEDLGMPKEDPEYVPPCMLLSGSPVLRELVRDLVSQVEATRKELVDRVIRGGFTFDTMRGAQFEQLMRLRTLNRSSARLPSLIHAPAIAPFEIYLELRELLGELAALHLGRDQFECASASWPTAFAICSSEPARRAISSFPLKMSAACSLRIFRRNISPNPTRIIWRSRRSSIRRRWPGTWRMATNSSSCP
jgi:predicted component of type VI protein secretion system